ncbi:unnamed protein product, partial [Ectocarpus fasciculatus]
TPTFTEYRASKMQYLEAARSPVLRLDCMKPQSALAHLVLPLPLFAKPFAKSLDGATIELVKRWCDISGQNRNEVVVTKGVRDSIYLLLSTLPGSCDQVVWPRDVYPVYEKLIYKALPNVNRLEQFDTLSGFDIKSIKLEGLSTNAVLVLPFPLTPLGAYIDDNAMDLLSAWLRDGPNRRIIFDCVYSYDMNNDCDRMRAVQSDQVAFAFSLAKSWASPFLEPLTIGGERMCMTCALTIECSRASLLSRKPRGFWSTNRSYRRFSRSWKRLEPLIKHLYPVFRPPESGYFSTLPISYVDLLKNVSSTCAVPVSVFGGLSRNTSVISCLYDIKDQDGAGADKYFWMRKSLQSTSEISASEEDEEDMYHVTTVSNFIKGYNKYTRVYSKESIVQSTFPDRFFLLLESQLQVGVEKASKLLNKLQLDGDALLVLHTSVKPSNCTLHPRGQFIDKNWVNIKKLSILRPLSDGFEKISVEEAAALSLKVNKTELLPYDSLKPRSISILPIAKGCQARCPFCFSKGSVSTDLAQKLLPPDIIEKVIRTAKNRGAERAVITGGGEPMMMPFNKLLALISQCSVFDTVCMITNGYYLSQLDENSRKHALLQLDSHGLTVLSVSRHAATDSENEKIMYLDTQSTCVAKTWAQMHERGSFSRLTRMRWVCVLQKGGVDNVVKLQEYLDFAASSGAPEICFKELYVSTSTESLYHDAVSNTWSEENQVPLSLVMDFCSNNGFKEIVRLPWGAPVFEGTWGGKTLRIAAYTEPSVYWERSNGLCRSWNLMADKSVMASLEDKDSAINYYTME